MKEVREAINDVLSRFARSIMSDESIRIYLSDKEWAEIEALIIEARPGEDEICAALDELDNKKVNSGPHTISLGADGSGVVRSDTLANLGPFSKGRAVAKIRSLIPPPEPTLEEWLTVLDEYVDVSKHYPPANSVAARNALTHIRKVIDKPLQGNVRDIKTYDKCLTAEQVARAADVALIRKYVADRCGEGWADVMAACDFHSLSHICQPMKTGTSSLGRLEDK